MDRKTIIAFGISGGLFVFGMWKQFRLHERIEILREHAVAVDELIDAIYQKVIIDPQFDEMTEHFDEE